MEAQVFKIGDKVRHKAKPDFDMVITGFAKYYIDREKKIVGYDYNMPLCKYYNMFTNRFEEDKFESTSLLLSEDCPMKE